MARGKKSQIIGQVFVYILVAIVVGGIVLVGYWAIKSILQKSCEVQQVNFKLDMEKMLSRSNAYGSISTPSISAPCGYSTIYFADASAIGSDTFSCSNMIVQESIKDNQQMNIFLANGKTTYPIGYSDYLELEDPNECLRIDSKNSRFYFTLQGQGQTTLLKPGS